MLFKFFKFHSYGDDGILFDCRESDPKLTNEQIIYLCDRNFGIGGNFIVCIYNAEKKEDEKAQYFDLVIYNPHGLEIDFEINAIRFACGFLQNEITKSITKFNTKGGTFLCKLDKDQQTVKVNVGKPSFEDDFVIINNEKHKIEIVENFEQQLDYSFNKEFSKNFVKIDSSDKITVRTVEKSIGEVFTSPSGVVASFSYCVKNNLIGNKASIETRGSLIMGATFDSVWEIEKPMIQNGPFVMIFEGQLEL